MLSADGILQRLKAKHTVCRTNAVEPAVPISHLYFPGVIDLGENDRDVEFSSAPSILARLTSAAILTEAKCWARNPGFFRRMRIFEILNA
jgi:hypothetical protein